MTLKASHTVRRPRSAGGVAPISASALAALLLAGCATATPGRQGQLSTYDGLQRTRNHRTTAYVKADTAAILAAKTFRLDPVEFADGVGQAVTPAQRALVANAASRAICAALSERLKGPAEGAPPDLVIRARITGFAATGRAMAGASFVLGHLSPIPMTPRIPLGLGSLSAEGEALGPQGAQAAALVWERGADAFFTDPKVSTVGDAYQLAGLFGHDLGELVVKGENPVRDVSLLSLPRRHHADPSCDRYGKGGGVTGFIAGRFAAAPEWTDRPKPPAAIAALPQGDGPQP
jgi:hypothetical protein